MEKERINQLIKEIGENNVCAFEELYNGLRRPLISFVYSIVHSASETEDILHDTFLEVIERSGNIRERTNCFAWIFTIAHNKAVNWKKKNGRVLYAEVFPVPENSCGEEEIATGLEMNFALSRLSTREEQFIRMHYVNGLSFVEIADLMKLKVDKVKYITYKAYAKLKKYFTMH